MSSLEKVGGHADRLEAAADAMQKDGVGLHDTRGHVAMLRRMASGMRADAANGRVPHAFTDNFYASAAVPQLPVQIVKTLTAAGLPSDGTISVAAFDEKTIAANIDPSERLRTQLTLDRLGRLTA
jgi:hypothetical protein